jgi:hypothetical protein
MARRAALWLCVASVLIVVLAGPVQAQIDFPQNSSLQNLVGDAWVKIGADLDAPINLGIIGSKTRLSIEWAQRRSSNVVPVTLTQIWQPSTAVTTPIYFGGGIGLWTAKFIGAGTASRFGLRLVGGVEFSERYFGEVEYDFVDKIAGTRADGLSLLIGVRL